MQASIVSVEALEHTLALRDLTDPTQGPHALQQLIELAHTALARRWNCPRQLHRGSPLVAASTHYDDLGHAADDLRYARHVSASHMLRSQTAALVPGLLRGLALDPPQDLLLVCPGMVYRRASVDRLHIGEPHQLDLWRIARQPLGAVQLGEMAQTVLRALLPNHAYRLLPSPRPHLSHGMRIEVYWQDQPVEIGECGLAAPALLRRCGHDPAQIAGLAMGLCLDRMLMIRKNIPDIRLLRAEDPRIAVQMLDLEPYRPVSPQPPVRREPAVAVDGAPDAGLVGEAP